MSPSENDNDPFDDEIDRREVLRRLPSWGPEWAAAIEQGIDVTQLAENLSMTVEERFRQFETLLQLQEELRHCHDEE